MRNTMNMPGRLAGAAVVATLIGAPATAWAGDPQLEGPREELAALDASLKPQPTAETVAQWTAKQRKLRVQLGVSASVGVALLLTGILVLTVPASCQDPDPDFGCGEGYGRVYTALVVFPAAAVAVIPTWVFGARLARHNERRPAARLQLAPGGFALRF